MSNWCSRTNGPLEEKRCDQRLERAAPGRCCVPELIGRSKAAKLLEAADAGKCLAPLSAPLARRKPSRTSRRYSAAKFPYFLLAAKLAPLFMQQPTYNE